MKSMLIASALLASAAAAAAAAPLPLAKFEAVELNGGGKVLLRHGPVQRVTLLSGDTEISDLRVDHRNNRRGKLVIDACDDRCPRNYRLEMLVESPDVDTLAVRGGGAIVADGPHGARRDMTVAVSGGGQIDLRRVPAADVTAAVSGGGALLVNATRNLTAAVRGGGSIRYWGDPEVTQIVSGGGRVERGS